MFCPALLVNEEWVARLLHTKQGLDKRDWRFACDRVSHDTEVQCRLSVAKYKLPRAVDKVRIGSSCSFNPSISGVRGELNGSSVRAVIIRQDLVEDILIECEIISEIEVTSR